MNKKYKDGKKNISHNPEVAGSNPVSAIPKKDYTFPRCVVFFCVKSTFVTVSFEWEVTGWSLSYYGDKLGDRKVKLAELVDLGPPDGSGRCKIFEYLLNLV